MNSFLTGNSDNKMQTFDNASKPQYRYWYMVPILLVLVSGALLGYDVTLAEPDLAMMRAALVYGDATGLGVMAGYHYGLSFSFGYYHLLYAIAPLGSLLDPDQAAKLLNNVGLVFAVLLALSSCLLLEKLLGRIAGVAAAIAFMGSPMMLSFTISGHPMVAATAFLFFGTWLLLVAQNQSRTVHSLMLALLTLLVLVAGLSFRAEIALAFPFVAVAVYFNAKPVFRNQAVWFGLAGAILTTAFVVFLVLQRPYVEASGGGGALVLFLKSFASIGKMGKGIGIFALGLGLFTLLTLPVLVLSRRLSYPVDLSHLLIGGTVGLPTFAFWLPNPQPARHFLFAIFGCYLILATLVRTFLVSVPRAMLFGIVFVLINQLCAELAYPVLVKTYKWSYQPVTRRATQQVPIGFFPLYQKANQAVETLLREEAIEFANSNPRQVIYLADFPFYLIAYLIAQDPSLRVEKATIGDFPATLLKNELKSIYFVTKHDYWPKDVLAEILKIPSFRDWKIKEQLLTKTPFDKTPLPKDREYSPATYSNPA